MGANRQKVCLSDISEWIEIVLREAGRYDLIDYAKSTVQQILTRTGHVATASGVAYCVGYCYYYARLCEAIGARPKKFLEDRLSGKGRDIHRIVGFAVLTIFERGLHHNITEDLLRDVVKGSINTLKERNLLLNPSALESLEDTSFKLLRNLFKNIHLMCSSLGISKIDNLRPIVEQMLLDYTIHIRGVPDLILEDPNEKKAIVIEWKTSRVSIDKVSDVEKAQVLIYSLLEARRLGYGTGRRLPPKEELKYAILGRLNGNKIVDFKILPVMIRPTDNSSEGIFFVHPAFSTQTRIEKEYYKYETLLNNIFIAAEHLTILLTNQERLTGTAPEDFSITLALGNGHGVKINVLRCKPKQLVSPNPRSCNRDRCWLRNACKFYFAREVGQIEDYERVLWGLRFSVFDDKERTLLAYKALYITFKQYPKEKVLDKLRKGYGIYVEINSIMPRVKLIKGSYGNKCLTGRILINRVVYKDGKLKSDIVQYGIDILDRVWVENDEIIIGVRKLREYERDSEDIALYHVVRGTIVLTPVDSWNPLLSINMFGRVEDVYIQGDRVVYIIEIPGKLLKYQKLLFMKYIKAYKQFRENVLMAEVGADLTQMELDALDKLQRVLKQELLRQRNEDIKQELERELGHINKLKQYIENKLPDVRSLKEILRILMKGLKREEKPNNIHKSLHV